ncbi:exodeoxyribonuclease V subunit beta [Neisseria montereyensis]|uniref:RecBCD enzyme subunit RecB n=1 Tax=Neisseria montereyensis TaxID=2973938 RepID=A0ABT2FCA8_9NEIS|nr:exodeoxyribonuclease V subunit beta [Neisseria montereyensis]MCS4533581.1 exodeoxyribonuclease V subunit beta [Neisseria montereyensis]
MQHMQPFHPLNVPIEGTNLVEASAGTGKTYGIAALFTRLIVLEKMSVESVLVVTFTKAATAELKNRLRARLDNVLLALEKTDDAGGSDGLRDYCAEHHEGDAFLLELLQKALAQESRQRLIVRLKAAISRFDNAAIYTIHGFCQRLLRDYAFLCQVPFDLTLSEETHERMLIAAQDFWRQKVAESPILAPLVFKHHETPQTALNHIRTFIGRPYLEFRRPKVDLATEYAALQTIWQTTRPKLAEYTETFWRIHPALNGNSYRKNTFEKLFANLQKADASDTIPSYHEKLPMLATQALTEKTKKGKAVSDEAYQSLNHLALLGEAIHKYEQSEQDALTALHLDLLEYVRTALGEDKQNRRERNFDDLLLDVHHALTQSPKREQLAQTVAANWKTALIDEFQDTDPLQYEIFSRLFIRQGNPLFLVGDPKQAIYSFRGADIYAYLQAARDADAHYTLDTNFRSHADLIHGIGAIFQQKNQPFVLNGIGYTDVKANRETGRLNDTEAPIRIRWINQAEDDSANKNMLRQRAAAYCADEIAHALNEAAANRLTYRKNGNSDAVPIQSGQIAVLVRTHNEGSMIATELKKRRIQSVLLHRESVFASPEAEAIAALIGFWLQPQRTEPLRFVLSGVLFRQTAAELYALNHDEAALLAWIASAQTAADIWQQSGVYAAMQYFSAQHGIETHLLAQHNERSLTNYHQIIERLAEEDEQSRSPAALHQWLLTEIQTAHEGGAAGDSNLLRLESDENLVKIVTMHAAKGLQYPLVYCPFVWDAPARRNDGWQIIHRDGHTELLAEHQRSDSDNDEIADENLSESLRLLYVALTRAEEQLVIYAGYCNDTRFNTFAYLLAGSPDTNRSQAEEIYATAKKTGKAAAEMATLRTNWQRFLEASPQAASFAFLETPPQTAVYTNGHASDGHYQALAIPPRSFELIRHTSFTGLSRHTLSRNDDAREELQPAIDAAESGMADLPDFQTAEPTDGNDIYHFPKGAEAGICLHEILENFDFAAPAAEQHETVSHVLDRYGFDPIWLPAVENMLDHTRLTPLGNRSQNSLAVIPPERRLAEMGFTLYLNDFPLKPLQAWFADARTGLSAACIQASQLLDFQDVKGFLNGFIDMTCQDSDGLVTVIDYKSNHLGYNAADYTPEAMDEAVAHHHYYLQALIYAIAVARHFQSRGQALPRISVRYLFLRGLDGSGNGIWSWDIDSDWLSAWVPSS